MQKTDFWRKRGQGDHKGLVSVYETAVETHRLSENEMGTKKPVAAALLPLRPMQMKLRLQSAGGFRNDQSQEHCGSGEMAQ